MFRHVHATAVCGGPRISLMCVLTFSRQGLLFDTAHTWLAGPMSLPRVSCLHLVYDRHSDLIPTLLHWLSLWSADSNADSHTYPARTLLIESSSQPKEKA